MTITLNLSVPGLREGALQSLTRDMEEKLRNKRVDASLVKVLVEEETDEIKGVIPEVIGQIDIKDVRDFCETVGIAIQVARYSLRLYNDWQLRFVRGKKSATVKSSDLNADDSANLSKELEKITEGVEEAKKLTEELEKVYEELG